MNKLSIALLIAGTAAATGFVVTKMLQNKKKSETDLFDECDCLCEDDLDVVIPDEDCAEDCAEAVEDAAEEVAEAVEEAVEEIKD